MASFLSFWLLGGARSKKCPKLDILMSSLGRRHTEKKGKAEKVWLGRQSVGETVNYSVLEQVVWQQGFKTLLQHTEKTL